VRGKELAITEFEDSLAKSIGDLDIAMTNLQTSVQLNPCTVDIEIFKKPSDYINAAHHPEVIAELES
jgi:hypothetical protein